MPDDGLQALIDEADKRLVARMSGTDIPGPMQAQGRIVLSDFYAHLPDHKYLHVPTRALWPAASVDGKVEWPTGASGKLVRPSAWLDANRPIVQMTWHPSEPELIRDKIVFDGGTLPQPGAQIFNLYRAPERAAGDAAKAGPWIDHIRRIYSDNYEHLLAWLAHRVQRPGEKVNHAIVMGGSQGIGKDTLLEPIIRAVGPWNAKEINPAQMLGRFNGWCKAVIVRVSEARDLGDVDRFAFYDHSKTYIAAPPDTIRCDEKNLREHQVFNVMGVIITTNHRTDGLYLPADDRRHYVAWSDTDKSDFSAGYWQRLWQWYESGGYGHVAEYLRTLDLSGFDPKAPPPKTPAFWAMVAAGEDPESGELRDVLEAMGNPSATYIDLMASRATSQLLNELAVELRDRKNRRSIPHKLERVGYVAVQNPDATDGLWRIDGHRRVIYAQQRLSLPEQIRAARLVK